MTVAELLVRLSGVRKTAPDRWLARCPAHEDKHPSLSIRALDDGRVLVHDFGGCDVAAVAAAAGITVSDLFPARVPDHRLGRAPRIPAGDVLAAIGMEIEVFVVAAADLAHGRPLSAGDHDRLRLAAARVRSAVEVSRGYR